MALLLICSLDHVRVHACLPLLRCVAPADSSLLMQQYSVIADCHHSIAMHHQPRCVSDIFGLNAHISRSAHLSGGTVI